MELNINKNFLKKYSSNGLRIYEIQIKKLRITCGKKKYRKIIADDFLVFFLDTEMILNENNLIKQKLPFEYKFSPFERKSYLDERKSKLYIKKNLFNKQM